MGQLTLIALKHWRESLIVVLLVVVSLSLVRERNALIERGKAEVRAAHADSVLASSRTPMARVDTLVVHDTEMVVKRVARLDTLRDTLLKHVSDTVLVKEFVARADLAAQSCLELSNDCAEFRRIATQRLAAYEEKIKAVQTIQPRRCGLALSAGVGGVYDRGVHVGPGVSLGLGCRW